MKKLMLFALIVGSLIAGGSVRAAENTSVGGKVVEKAALYVPNLILDALDTFTVNVGFGPIVEARLQGTAAVWGGGRVGMAWKMYKAYNRQYGFGTETGWYWEFVSVGEENVDVIESTSLVNKYTERRTGFPMPTRRIYDVREGSRDYWALGGSLGGIVTGDLFIHPIDIADFATGIFFYDLKGDDLTFADFQ